jgi:hypothetical protein
MSDHALPPLIVTTTLSRVVKASLATAKQLVRLEQLIAPRGPFENVVWVDQANPVSVLWNTCPPLPDSAKHSSTGNLGTPWQLIPLRALDSGGAATGDQVAPPSVDRRMVLGPTTIHTMASQ